MSSVFYVEKRGKYLQGSSYTTGLGTKNHWTYSIVNAKVFFASDVAQSKAKELDGRVVELCRGTRIIMYKKPYKGDSHGN